MTRLVTGISSPLTQIGEDKRKEDGEKEGSGEFVLSLATIDHEVNPQASIPCDLYDHRTLSLLGIFFRYISSCCEHNCSQMRRRPKSYPFNLPTPAIVNATFLGVLC
jgi:hypothetical protein